MKETLISDAQCRRSERGSILAMSAFGMLAFLLAVGLCLDVSHFYVVRAELSNAADASALAGASALNSSPSGIALAQERAVEVMNNFEFDNTGVTITPADVKFAINFGGPYMSASDAQAVASDIRFVQVDVPPKNVGVYVASIALNKDEVQMAQRAIAGMSVSPNVHCEWIPLSVIDIPLVAGTTYTVRAAPGEHISPGNYQILAVAGRGGKDAKYGLAGGVDLCAEPGHTYEVDTKPGVVSGPVRSGLNTRFDDYSGGLSPTDYPPDVNVKEDITWDDYKKSLHPSTRDGSNYEAADPSHHPVAYRRVVLIPIIKLDEFDQGRNTVKFDRFAPFFMQSKVQGGNGGELKMEYIDEPFAFGKGGYRPGGGPVTPELTMPVLYK